MKKFFIVLGIIVVSFLVCIAILKDQIIKSVVIKAASEKIGAQVHMDGFSLSVLDSTIRISGFKIDNPVGFPEGILAFCPEINVIYDRATLLKPNPHFFFIDIELKEIGIARNQEGKLNVDELKIVQRSKDTPLQIDLFTLSIGKIVYKDYTIGTEPKVRVYDVNSYNSYENILAAKQVALLLFAEPMKIVAIKKAGIYGIVEATSVSALRVAGQGTLIGKDNVVQEIIDVSFEHVYEVSLEVLERMGTISKDDAPNGAIKANINGAMVALQLRKKAGNAIEITISARKFLFPKLDIAGGVLYQVLDKLQPS